ncbi:MAG: n-acetylglutamate synthase [Epsilonproteobacteria bacterium]|nr:n-acetylglutamate synthase [Campylobacterota bacterium]
MINLNKKIFTTDANSSNGEVNKETFFYYSQEKNIISADYSGGQIIKGHLVGKQLDNGKFDFVYHHINKNGVLKVGKCLSKAKILSDGRIKLFENWQWLCDDMSSGSSELMEVIQPKNY